MALKKQSINDIAKHLKVAKSTVSFIINGKAEERRISKDLEKRVLDYVQEVGFKPHLLAKSLATGKSNSIGLIVENIGDSFFGPIALKIEEKAKKSGYRIVYSSTLGNTEAAISILQLFRETQVDGFIIAPPANMEQAIQEVLEEGAPVVIFDRILQGIETNYVGTNNEEITYEACCHLITQGFKQIAFVTLDSVQSQMQERQAGYAKSIEDNSYNQYILEIPYLEDRAGYKQQIIDFLQQHTTVDAVFFATNYLCVSGLEALREMGKSIPDDIGVIVFDENDLFKLYSPPITAIAQPLDALSAGIIDTLMKKITKKETRNSCDRIIVPSSLIIRQSSIRKK